MCVCVCVCVCACACVHAYVCICIMRTCGVTYCSYPLMSLYFVNMPSDRDRLASVIASTQYCTQNQYKTSTCKQPMNKREGGSSN